MWDNKTYISAVRIKPDNANVSETMGGLFGVTHLHLQEIKCWLSFGRGGSLGSENLTKYWAISWKTVIAWKEWSIQTRMNYNIYCLWKNSKNSVYTHGPHAALWYVSVYYINSHYVSNRTDSDDVGWESQTWSGTSNNMVRTKMVLHLKDFRHPSNM